jgi:TPP-dependent trihydroxycyclohexane-1,2-dione (THcHDO) dehydratase
LLGTPPSDAVRQAAPLAPNGAEVIIRTLLQLGVDTVFGYPGGAVLPLYDALHGEPRLRHVLVRHEQAAVHAAQGYARSTGRVGVAGQGAAIKAFYQRLLAAAKPKKVALTACACKRLIVLNAMVRTRKPFDAALHLA